MTVQRHRCHLSHLVGYLVSLLVHHYNVDKGVGMAMRQFIAMRYHDDMKRLVLL